VNGMTYLGPQRAAAKATLSQGAGRGHPAYQLPLGSCALPRRQDLLGSSSEQRRPITVLFLGFPVSH